MFKKKKENEEIIQNYQVNDFYEEPIESSYNSYNSFQYNDENIQKKKTKIPYIVIAITLIYAAFIGIGVLTTTYTNNQPQIISIELRENRKNYQKASSNYNNIKDIIDNLNTIDSKLDSDGVDKSFNYATEYKKYIDTISDLTVQIKGSSYSDNYQFLQEIALAICTNLTKYVNLMSNGMSAQSANYISQARQYKEQYLVQFDKYTANMEQFKASGEQ